MKTPLRKRLTNPRNRLVRCYDNGGTYAGGTIDRYTVIFCEPVRRKNGCCFTPATYGYLAMSAEPFHPQGFGQRGEIHGADMEHPPTRYGRVGHLGRRIPFTDLPPDCQRLVIQDLTHCVNSELV